MYEIAGKLEEKILGVRFSNDNDIAIYLKQAGWCEVFKVNIPGFFYRYGYLFFVSRIPKVLGVFLIGYALGRSDFYKNIRQHKKTLYIIIVAGLLIGLPANYMLAYYMSSHSADYWKLNMYGLYQTIAYSLGVVPLALVYVAVFMLAFQTAMGKKLLSVLAPVGKMAFSNYVLQSVIGTVVFLGPGLGYISQTGPVYNTLFGLLVFTGQVIMSNLWLRYFNYGPVEWLWRSLTYRKMQPMRIMANC